jgi:hypothetical protein
MGYKMYSNSAQDFVLNLLDNKTGGYYVELGAFHSTIGSETNRLERDHAWNGVSFEIVPELHAEFISNRKNPCILGDARTFDYVSYFKENNFPKQIDFLQVDIDAGYEPSTGRAIDPYCSLQGLMAIPWNHYRFSVITFEHDFAMNIHAAAQRDAVREIMLGYDYFLAGRLPHEDWWFDPSAIEFNHAQKYFHFDAY